MSISWGVRSAAFLAWAVGMSSLARADDYVEYTGRAVVHQSAQFAYDERHFLAYQDGRLKERVVLYTCRDGSAFARKSVDYIRPTAPNFLLEDASGGMREGVREAQGRRVMFFRSRAGERERSAALPDLADLVIDAGFDQFIADHWAVLTGPGRAPMHFLVPSRLESMNFDVVYQRRETVSGTDSEVFRLKLSGVLGWLMSGIDVAYSRSAHVLVRYEGLADLRGANGDNIAADISFDPAARHPSNAAAGRALRETPLNACPPQQ